MFDSLNWQPPTREQLKAQANLFKEIRSYFDKQGVLEVSTPIASTATTPDPSIRSLKSYLHNTPEAEKQLVYLHTSPEFAMKRLLVNGSEDIYQLCSVFRDSDFSPIHNAEFTMLEWYRLGFSHHDLMDDLFALISKLQQVFLGSIEFERVDLTYRQLFEKYADLNPFTVDVNDCELWCKKHKLSYPDSLEHVDEFLDLILSFHIQPQFSDNQITFVYDYPVSQASLAKVRNEKPKVASRFEMYWGNMELANGFHELQDGTEQRKRFEDENAQRDEAVLLDENFLQDLVDSENGGLPDCSGVALGVSRLMLKLGIA